VLVTIEHYLSKVKLRRLHPEVCTKGSLIRPGKRWAGNLRYRESYIFDAGWCAAHVAAEFLT
jgi:hypothetical protein